MLWNCGVGEDSWESLGLQGDPTSPFWRRSVLGALWKDWCWSWNSNTLATWCEKPTHFKRPWCWERLKVGGEGDNRGWDGWMASLTQWTWVWVNSGSWWWTGRPGVLQSMGLQRVGHDWAPELNWTEMSPEATKVYLRTCSPRCVHVPEWGKSPQSASEGFFWSFDRFGVLMGLANSLGGLGSYWSFSSRGCLSLLMANFLPNISPSRAWTPVPGGDGPFFWLLPAALGERGALSVHYLLSARVAGSCCWCLRGSSMRRLSQRLKAGILVASGVGLGSY